MVSGQSERNLQSESFAYHLHKPLSNRFLRVNGKEPGIPFIPENFQWKEPKSRVPFTSQPEFPEFFGKWKTPCVTHPPAFLLANFGKFVS